MKYKIQKLHEELSTGPNLNHIVNNNIKLKCEKCNKIFENRKINEFFGHLYCEICLNYKINHRKMNFYKNVSNKL